MAAKAADAEIGMSTSTDVPAGVAWGSEFARELPELSVPATAFRHERPAILVVNDDLATELGLDAEWLRSESGVRFLMGNALPPGAAPVAQAYAGHQFGSYSPILGDGRALLLGELRDRSGRLRDVHLKGSGPTRFARADGFAPASSMLREYLMGEAMHALGIPTTRALAVVATGHHVMREEAFDPLPGAVLVRTAASHLRVGTFQFARSTGDLALLRRLADHAIARHYPELADSDEPYLALLHAVIEAQARLVASWMLVGFVHGVMNTDNMTISGETIDYGPCAFLDRFDPAAVFSSIDHGGRYAYGNQPGIAHWNLTRFAESLLPLLAQDRGAAPDEASDAASDAMSEAKDLATDALSRFGPAYDAAWIHGMREKLGLATVSEERLSAEGLVELAGALFTELRARGADYTASFRALADAARGRLEPLRGILGMGVDGAIGEAPAGSSSSAPAASQWLTDWLALAPDADAMDRVNPVYIPRNQLVDEALDAASAGDLGPFAEILDAVSRPFERRAGLERFERPSSTGSRRHITYCGT